MENPEKQDSQETNSGQENEPKTKIRVGRVGSVDIYEIEEWELMALEEAKSNPIGFGFAISLLTLAFAFLISILTANPQGNLFIFFLLMTILGAMVGLFIMSQSVYSWRKKRNKSKDLAKNIRDRIQPQRRNHG